MPLVLNLIHIEIYMLLTTVDECEKGSRTKFLKQLRHLLSDRTIRRCIKIVITSRPHLRIESQLTDIIRIPLVAENLQSDITAYVEAEVYKQPQFSGRLGNEVRQALIDGANGMFLWVSLVLEDLKKSTNTTPRGIRKALETLPPDLPGVYISILRNIRNEDQIAAQTILRWVVWAIRPLTLQELTIAIAIRQEHTSMSSIKDDMHTDLRQVLRLLFGPLLRIEADNSVHLIHQSAKEFLSNMSAECNLPGRLLPAICLSSVESNLHIAVSCLTYLSFDECENGPAAADYMWEANAQRDIALRKQNIPFLLYAAAYWHEHTKQTERSDEHHVLFSGFRKLAESPHKIDLAYQISSFSRFDVYEKITPLQIAASLGLIIFVERLLAHSADINDMGGALRVAASHGQEAIVQMLVEQYGVDKNASDYSGMTALHSASRRDHKAVVRLLVEKFGVDINTSDNFG